MAPQCLRTSVFLERRCDSGESTVSIPDDVLATSRMMNPPLKILQNHQASGMFFGEGKTAIGVEVYDVSESSNFQAGGVSGVQQICLRWNSRNPEGEKCMLWYIE